MKKLKKFAPLAALVLIAFAGIFKCFDAKAEQTQKVIVTCKCCEDGEQTGNANDCATGNGACIPTDCPANTTKDCGVNCPGA